MERGGQRVNLGNYLCGLITTPLKNYCCNRLFGASCTRTIGFAESQYFLRSTVLHGTSLVILKCDVATGPLLTSGVQERGGEFLAGGTSVFGLSCTQR